MDDDMMICKNWKTCKERNCGGKRPHEKTHACENPLHRTCPGCISMKDIGEDFLLGATNG
jgi:hypothetical protein